MIDQEILVPELKDWRQLNGAHFDIESWVGIEGNIRLAVAFSFIFWPQFLEHDGCVFLKSHFDAANYEAWKTAESVDSYGDIEAIVNHIHIQDLFSYEQRTDMTREQVVYLGNALRDMYAAKLKAEFPAKVFIVDFNGDAALPDLIDYELTFFQVANKLRRVG